MALIDNYTKEELEEIVKNSKSIKEVISKLGYSTNGGSNSKTVKNRIEKYGISIEHFTSTVNPTIRTEENVFIEDSTASQAVLRRWYFKGKYTPYTCSICGQLPEWQGKELTLILDHINGHNHDDRLENLRWVCPNCNQQLDTTGTKRGFSHLKKVKLETKEEIKKEEKPKKQHLCIDCGNPCSSNATRCQKCDNEHRKAISHVNDLITREELKKLIRTMPFTKIGEQFNISDNAVRKWCDRFDLPRRKSEINKYSDKEWETI